MGSLKDMAKVSRVDEGTWDKHTDDSLRCKRMESGMHFA